MKYDVKTGYDMTDEFILNVVCPNIGSLVLVLGCALLWAIFNEEACKQIENRI